MNAKLTCCIILALLGQPLYGQGATHVSGSTNRAAIAFLSDQPSPSDATIGSVPAIGSLATPTPAAVSTESFIPAPASSLSDMMGCDSCVPCGPSCGVPGCACKCGLSVYGGFIYWRPRDADVSFAAPINGPINVDDNPIFVGPVGIADPDYQPGYFAGFQWALECGTFLDVRYTMLETNTNAVSRTDAPEVLRSLVAHPSTDSAASDFLSSTAGLSIDLDYLDASYRHLFRGGPKHAVHYFVGGRYARLEQSFSSLFANGGTETVQTDLDFEGGGIMLGLDAVRFSCCHGVNVFASSSASFVAGRFRGNYLQGTNADPIIVDTLWEAGRLVPILDLEVGVGWTSKQGHVSAGVGYLVGAWFNTPNTEDFIHSVQDGDFSGTDDALSFDGLTAHLELVW